MLSRPARAFFSPSVWAFWVRPPCRSQVWGDTSGPRSWEGTGLARQVNQLSTKGPPARVSFGLGWTYE